MSYPCQGIEELKIQIVCLATKEWESWVISTGIKKSVKGGALKRGPPTPDKHNCFLPVGNVCLCTQTEPSVIKAKKAGPVGVRESWLPRISSLYLFLLASLNKQRLWVPRLCSLTSTYFLGDRSSLSQTIKSLLWEGPQVGEQEQGWPSGTLDRNSVLPPTSCVTQSSPQLPWTSVSQI